nr:hypothetical protein GZ27B6_41 [uncultured archaeon GZfos27B6]
MVRAEIRSVYGRARKRTLAPNFSLIFPNSPSPLFLFCIYRYTTIFVQSINAIKSPYIAIASASATNISTRPNVSGFSAVAPAAATPVADIAQPAPSAPPAIVMAAAIAIHPLSVTPLTVAAVSSCAADATPAPARSTSTSKQSVNANAYFVFMSFSITSYFSLFYRKVILLY